MLLWHRIHSRGGGAGKHLKEKGNCSPEQLWTLARELLGPSTTPRSKSDLPNLTRVNDSPKRLPGGQLTVNILSGNRLPFLEAYTNPTVEGGPWLPIHPNFPWTAQLRMPPSNSLHRLPPHCLPGLEMPHRKVTRPYRTEIKKNAPFLEGQH